MSARTVQLALCPAPVRRALPRASVDAELRAAIRKHHGLRWVPFSDIARIYFRESDERLTLTIRPRWWE